MEGLKITKRPRLKKPYLIAAWPGMGEVAVKAANYLVEKLGAEQFAEIEPAEFFYLTGSVVREGILNVPELPSSKFYYWKNKTGANDLIIFLSNSQPDLVKAKEYSLKIIQLAKMFKVETAVSFASMPLPIDHLQDPAVWMVSTSPEVRNSLSKYNFKVLSEGQISGMNGLFLGLAKSEGLKGFCLLGEIPLYTIQIENPKASLAVVSALAKILSLKIDFAKLIEQTRVIEEDINKLMDYLKAGAQPGQVSPIGEDEIERIKKSLGQLTKLPISIKKKIEELFEQSKIDIKQASYLKQELDKWNVYKDYEDRFLDLFKKEKNNNN